MLKTDDLPHTQGESVRREIGKPWQRGAVSPNPGGRPKKTEHERTAEKLAKQKAPAAMRRLVEMIDSPKTSESGRLRAIELLLDRALGKASVRNDAPGGERTYVIQQIVSQPPVGGFPGVLSHPDPRWIAQPSPRTSGAGEVIDVEGTNLQR